VAKQVKRLPKAERLKVFRKLDQLRQSSSPVGKKLRGQLVDSWSLKAWPYRIVYIYFPEKNLIIVKTVQHRQGVYN